MSALRRRALANSYDFLRTADGYAAGNNLGSLNRSPRTIMAQAMRATSVRPRPLGRVRHDEMQAWLRGKGVRLVGGGLDEAPQAYRRLPDVLAHHTGTVKIEHTLRPFAVLMAGVDVFDPFKD